MSSFLRKLSYVIDCLNGTKQRGLWRTYEAMLLTQLRNEGF